MKNTQILLLSILLLFTLNISVSATACTTGGTACANDECCDVASSLCVTLLSSSAYVKTRTSATSHDCVALDATKCLSKTNYIVGTPSASLCKDSTTKECRSVASPYAYGITSATDFTCIATDATTLTAPKCVDPVTKITTTVLAASKFCMETTTKQCETLAYSNGLPRYTMKVATSDLTCVITTGTGLCGTGVCGLGQCCVTSTCTDAGATKCLKSATELACVDITATLVYSVAGDASCVATSTLTAAQCYNSATKVITTLTSSSTQCINTDKVCTDLQDAAKVAKYTQTSTTEFTCKEVATTTTTTTTTGSQINLILGSLIILISFILI